MDEEIKFNSLIPELSVSNIENSKKFYQELGFKIIYERPEDKFCFIQLDQKLSSLTKTMPFHSMIFIKLVVFENTFLARFI